MGIVEFYVQRRFYVDLMPTAYRDALMEANPAFAALVTSSPFRNGYYRASSIFGVPLPFGEFEAMVMPLGLYCLVHARSVRSRILGVAVIISVLLGIFTSGARGGYISMMAATAGVRVDMDSSLRAPESRQSGSGIRGWPIWLLLGRAGSVDRDLGTAAQHDPWRRPGGLSTDARWAAMGASEGKTDPEPDPYNHRPWSGTSGEVIGYYSPGLKFPSSTAIF